MYPTTKNYDSILYTGKVVWFNALSNFCDRHYCNFSYFWERIS